MRTSLLAAWSSLAIAIGLSAQTPTGPRAGVDWPGFRGIEARGVDEQATPPLQWSVPASKLVRWRVPVAGLGHSSPVVWGDQVCTATAISGTPDPQLKVGLYGDIESVRDTTSHRWMVLCFDKQTGALRWERTAKSGVPSSSAIPSPRTPVRRWPPTGGTWWRSSDRKGSTPTT